MSAETQLANYARYKQDWRNRRYGKGLCRDCANPREAHNAMCADCRHKRSLPTAPVLHLCLVCRWRKTSIDLCGRCTSKLRAGCSQRERAR